MDADEKDNTLQLIDHILFMVKEHNLPVKIELLNHPFRLIGAIEKDLSGLLQVPQREREHIDIDIDRSHIACMGY